VNKLFAVEFKGINRWKGHLLMTVAADSKVSAIQTAEDYITSGHLYIKTVSYKGTGARFLQGTTDLPTCVVTVHDFLERI